MNQLVPLLHIVAGDDIHQIRNPLDAPHALCIIVDLEFINLIDKLLYIIDLTEVDLVTFLEVGVHRIAYGAVVQATNLLDQLLEDLQHRLLSLMLDFVTDAPDQNRRTVAIALHHHLDVRLPIRLEVATIETAGPLIETLFVDIEAKFICQIEEEVGKEMVR